MALDPGRSVSVEIGAREAKLGLSRNVARPCSGGLSKDRRSGIVGRPSQDPCSRGGAQLKEAAGRSFEGVAKVVFGAWQGLALRVGGLAMSRVVLHHIQGVECLPALRVSESIRTFSAGRESFVAVSVASPLIPNVDDAHDGRHDEGKGRGVRGACSRGRTSTHPHRATAPQVRLFKYAAALRRMLLSLMGSFMSLFWSFVLLCFVFYLFSLATVQVRLADRCARALGRGPSLKDSPPPHPPCRTDGDTDTTGATTPMRSTGPPPSTDKAEASASTPPRPTHHAVARERQT